MYDRFRFSENIIHLQDQFFLAPFPIGDDLPNEVLQDLISVQRNDPAITPSTNWMNTFLVDMPKHHRDYVYHTWIVGVFSDDKILQRIAGTVDIQFVDYCDHTKLLVPHVGYWISQGYRRQGIASLALCKMMKVYGFPKYGARIEKDNYASLNLAKKCGFQEVSYNDNTEYFYFECNFRS